MQTHCLQRRLGTFATSTCIVSKLSACICMYSGFCINVLALPSHCFAALHPPPPTPPSSSVRSHHLPPEALEMEQQRFLKKMGVMYALTFQHCSAFFLPYSNTILPFISCFFFTFFSHNLSPCSTKSAFLSASVYQLLGKDRIWKERWLGLCVCVCVCFSVTPWRLLTRSLSNMTLLVSPNHTLSVLCYSPMSNSRVGIQWVV